MNILLTGESILRRRVGRADVDTPDPAVVARLSALQEERILDYFWLMVRGEAVDRLGLLLQITPVVVQRPAEWSYAAIRREHESYRPAFGVKLDRKRCFACDAGHRTLYFHHIIEVHHGGSNTLRNQVPLCFACHQFLHPWLKDPDPVVGTALEVVAAIAPRAIALGVNE